MPTTNGADGNRSVLDGGRRADLLGGQYLLLLRSADTFTPGEQIGDKII